MDSLKDKDLEWMKNNNKTITFVIIEVIKNGERIASTLYPEKDWENIGLIDYIDIDNNNKVITMYNEEEVSYLKNIEDKLQSLVDIATA